MPHEDARDSFPTIRTAPALADIAKSTGFAALIIVCSSLPAWAEKGVVLSNNTWNVEVKAVEPAANPKIKILSHQESRAKHVWARLRGAISFQCQVRNGVIEAVNPVISLARPSKTPFRWRNLQAFAHVINIAATQLTLKPADIRQARLDLTTGFARPGCFSVVWTARFDKKGTVITYRLNPATGVNPTQNPPHNVQLDENMDDTLIGQTRICCCSFELSEVANNKPKPGETPLSVKEPTEKLRAGILELIGEEKAGDYLKYIGIDWFAENISSPNPKDQHDPKTGWEGKHDLKQCTYQGMQVKMTNGHLDDRIKTNGPIPPGSKTNKPVATSFTIP